MASSFSTNAFKSIMEQLGATNGQGLDMNKLTKMAQHMDPRVTRRLSQEMGSNALMEEVQKMPPNVMVMMQFVKLHNYQALKMNLTKSNMTKEILNNFFTRLTTNATPMEQRLAAKMVVIHVSDAFAAEKVPFQTLHDKLAKEQQRTKSTKSQKLRAKREAARKKRMQKHR